MAKKKTASKKKTSKKRGRSPQPTPPEGLQGTLAQYIRDELLMYQGNGGTRAVIDPIIDALHPDKSEIFKISQQVTARMSDVHQLLKDARRDDEIYPWIIPSLATIWFEGVFEGCVAVWLIAGNPDDPSKLKSAVEQYIKISVKSFSTVIGA